MEFSKILVGGCSFANGYGLEGQSSNHDNPQIWANQLANKFSCNHIDNVAKTGANNHWIFLDVVSALIKQHYDLVIVEWSAIPRFKFRVGLELYDVDNRLDRDINIVGHETISAKWLQELKNRLLKIHNDHWDILDLVKYINILIELQEKARSGRIFFVNGLAPWPDGYFDKKSIQLPSDLDPFTSRMLQVDQRDDLEILQLYDMIHDHYTRYGGIQETHWLNLYSSMRKNRIDTVSATDSHPGYASQDMFAEQFYDEIKSRCARPNL